MQTSIIQILSNTFGIKNLPKEDLKKLASICVLKSFKKNEIIFHQGERAEFAWILTKGRVTIGTASKNGSQKAVCIAHTGDLFCCLPIMDGQPYLASGVCSEKSELLRLPIQDLNDILLEHPSVYKTLISKFCSKLRDMECRQCGQMDLVSDKIKTVLGQYSRQHGYLFKTTRSEIAQLSGSTVETVIRRLSQLKKQKIISGKRGEIHILKPEYFLA